MCYIALFTHTDHCDWCHINILWILTDFGSANSWCCTKVAVVVAVLGFCECGRSRLGSGNTNPSSSDLGDRFLFGVERTLNIAQFCWKKNIVNSSFQRTNTIMHECLCVCVCMHTCSIDLVLNLPHQNIPLSRPIRWWFAFYVAAQSELSNVFGDFRTSAVRFIFTHSRTHAQMHAFSFSFPITNISPSWQNQ